MIDVFYKVKALHEAGIRIHLHCFEYGERKKSIELEAFCNSVNYYKRKSNKALLLSSLPYIVITRTSDELINNLLKDKHPILFEGLHCSYLLDDERLKTRLKIVRMHNIEHDYYNALAGVEENFFDQQYLKTEAKKLKRYESILNKANHVIAISPADTQKLSEKYKNVINVTAFHPNEEISVKEGKGDFALYHGNLKIAENSEAALFLMRKIFNDLKIPLIVAGNNPSKKLINEAKKYNNIELKADIHTSEIHELIRSAQINILPTFQETGIKLKLLAALYNGRYCIVNSPMVIDTGLESLCSIKDTPEEMKKEITRLFNIPFDQKEKIKRKEILSKYFSNKKNAEKMIALLN